MWSSRWNENWQGKPKYSEKTCSSATLPITNPTWPDLGSNPDHRGGKPATNRLSYGTAFIVHVTYPVDNIGASFNAGFNFQAFATKIVVMHLLSLPWLFFCPHATIREWLNRFSWNFILWSFTRIRNWVKIGQRLRTLYTKTCAHFCAHHDCNSLSIYLIEKCF
jgi:hypothetical protein